MPNMVLSSSGYCRRRRGPAGTRFAHGMLVLYRASRGTPVASAVAVRGAEGSRTVAVPGNQAESMHSCVSGAAASSHPSGSFRRRIQRTLFSYVCTAMWLAAHCSSPSSRRLSGCFFRCRSRRTDRLRPRLSLSIRGVGTVILSQSQSVVCHSRWREGPPSVRRTGRHAVHL